VRRTGVVADFTYVATWAAPCTWRSRSTCSPGNRRLAGRMSKETDLVLDAIDMGLASEITGPGRG
jgi:hypothetical protein